MKCYDSKQHKTTSRKTNTKEHLETKKANTTKRKNKNQKEKIKNRKEGRKKRTRERQRKRKGRKGGGPKKAKEKQRETLKNKQKCPFIGGKQVFFVYEKTVKLQASSLLPAPLPKAQQSPELLNGHLWLKNAKAGARALHYDYDYNDHSKRENEKEKTGGRGDYNDRSRYYNSMSSCV